MSMDGIKYDWFRDNVLEEYYSSKNIPLNQFDEWLIKKQFKLLLTLEKCYKLLPDGDYGEDIQEVKRALCGITHFENYYKWNKHKLEKRAVEFKNIELVKPKNNL